MKVILSKIKLQHIPQSSLTPEDIDSPHGIITSYIDDLGHVKNHLHGVMELLIHSKLNERNNFQQLNFQST